MYLKAKKIEFLFSLYIKKDAPTSQFGHSVYIYVLLWQNYYTKSIHLSLTIMSIDHKNKNIMLADQRNSGRNTELL